MTITATRGNILAVHSTRGTIIRLTKLTDTSLIVHWLSEEHGLVKTVAKGARRPKSPFAGKLDLFFGGELVFQWSRQGGLHTLREVAIDAWRHGLRRDYPSTLFAAYCCLLLEKALEPEHPEPQLHDLLDRALNHVDTDGPSLRALHHYEREMARILGVAHIHRPADQSLRAILGELPASRNDLIRTLSTDADLDS
jgi:DNA repair protein RecO (recombination protein O)